MVIKSQLKFYRANAWPPGTKNKELRQVILKVFVLLGSKVCFVFNVCYPLTID